LFTEVYDDLATFTPLEVFQGFISGGGWTTSPLNALIGLLAVTNEVSLLASFDANSAALICKLKESVLNKTTVLSWIASTFSGNVPFRDALTHAFNAASDTGQYGTWIAIGSLVTGANCTACDAPVACAGGILADFTVSQGGWQPTVSDYAFYRADTGWERGTFDIKRLGIIKAFASTTITSVVVKFLGDMTTVGVVRVLENWKGYPESPVAQTSTWSTDANNITTVTFTGLNMVNTGLYIDCGASETMSTSLRLISVCVNGT